MVKPKAPSSHEYQFVSLGQLLQTIWGADDLDARIAIALHHIRETYHYKLLWLGQYDRFKHQLNTRGVKADPRRGFGRPQLALSPGDLMEQVVVQRRPILVPDLTAEPRSGEWRALAKKHGLQSAAIYPIRRKSDCFGVLVLASDQWGLTPDTAEKSTLMTLTGALAEGFYQTELEQQRQRVKQPSKPLFTLLEKLEKTDGLKRRLQLVVDETHRFIGAAQASVFWFDAQTRCFQHRASNQWQRKSSATRGWKGAQSLMADEVKGFYQSLSRGEMVVVGEAETSLKAGMVGRLMSYIQAQSLLAAPIMLDHELLGFISVEGAGPRVWAEPEKQYLQGVARLLGLTMPAAEMTDEVSQIKANQVLTAGLAQSIHSDSDWQEVLSLCADQLFDQLAIENLVVLRPDLERGGFESGFQSHRGQGKPAVRPDWRPLHDLDWQLLEQSVSPICIENLEDDLKLVVWRPRFLEMGAKSVMACNVTPGRAPEGVIVVTTGTSRRWSQTDRDLLQAVSQQVGLLLHQWQLQRQADQQTQLHETMQWGLRNLQRVFQASQLEQTATHHIAQLLQVPLVTLITWEPKQAQAKIADVVIRQKGFAVQGDQMLSVTGDAIISWALQTDGILTLNLEDLPDITRQWLQGPHGCDILLVALRTAPEHEPSGVIVLADHSDRQWTDQQMNMLAILVNQLAWCRRHLLLTGRLTKKQRKLAELNWYKQHQIDQMQRQLGGTLQRLNAFSFEHNFATNQRYQQMLRQLQLISERLNYLTQKERWSLQKAYETLPLVTLINRLMDRVNPIVQKKQLWTKVHCESNLTLGGDMQKIEFVLYELIARACDRTPVGGRVDIWCRQLDRKWLEVSITDSGEISATIIQALKDGHSKDSLVDSVLTRSPGLQLDICRSLLNRLGGEFTMEQLEDNRTLSRAILPLARSHNRHKLPPKPLEEQVIYSTTGGR
ncbi:MAG: GAF domain-containing protein [Cyanobacteria bacterium P01_A01_bin.105]